MSTAEKIQRDLWAEENDSEIVIKTQKKTALSEEDSDLNNTKATTSTLLDNALNKSDEPLPHESSSEALKFQELYYKEREQRLTLEAQIERLVEEIRVLKEENGIEVSDITAAVSADPSTVSVFEKEWRELAAQERERKQKMRLRHNHGRGLKKTSLQRTGIVQTVSADDNDIGLDTSSTMTLEPDTDNAVASYSHDVGFLPPTRVLVPPNPSSEEPFKKPQPGLWDDDSADESDNMVASTALPNMENKPIEAGHSASGQSTSQLLDPILGIPVRAKQDLSYLMVPVSDNDDSDGEGKHESDIRSASEEDSRPIDGPTSMDSNELLLKSVARKSPAEFTTTGATVANMPLQVNPQARAEWERLAAEERERKQRSRMLRARGPSAGSSKSPRSRLAGTSTGTAKGAAVLSSSRSLSNLGEVSSGAIKTGLNEAQGTEQQAYNFGAGVGGARTSRRLSREGRGASEASRDSDSGWDDSDSDSGDDSDGSRGDGKLSQSSANSSSSHCGVGVRGVSSLAAPALAQGAAAPERAEAGGGQRGAGEGGLQYSVHRGNIEAEVEAEVLAWAAGKSIATMLQTVAQVYHGALSDLGSQWAPYAVPPSDPAEIRKAFL